MGKAMAASVMMAIETIAWNDLRMRFPLGSVSLLLTGILRFAVRLDQRAEVVKCTLAMRGLHSFLGLERPRQQPLDRRIDRQSAVQDGGDRLRDRHVDVPRGRKLDQHRRGEGAFGKLAGRRGLAAAERDTKREIA